MSEAPAPWPARLLCSWFGAGLLPKAPGTWGSLAALPLAWLLGWAGGWSLLALTSLALFLIGWWASAIVARDSVIDDPGWVVIDEVVGICLTLMFTSPGWLGYGVGFILFRLFDIFKPGPIGWADRHIKGGFGIMLDDVLAGCMALALQSLLHYGGLI